jgi:hypothetical protein
MNTFKKRFDQIIADSPELIRHTKEYKQKVEIIQAEVNLKYNAMLICEKNVFKKVLLRIKRRNEINRAIEQLTSPGNLYVTINS